MRVDFSKIQSICHELKSLMNSRYPNDGWTLHINVWMDDTFQVICRSGIKSEKGQVLIREYKWYDSKIIYSEFIVSTFEGHQPIHHEEIQS